MIHYSVLIPQRDSADAVNRLLPRLRVQLERLLLPFELICIDDASCAPQCQRLEALLDDFETLRVLRFDEPRGASAALSAGIAAARGDLIVALGAEPRFDLAAIPHLISRLSRHDLVVARREQTLRGELCARMMSFGRLLSRDAKIHAEEDLLWAARREAVSGLALPQGAFRILPVLVAERGFRVCQLTLAAGLPPRCAEYPLGRSRRLAAAWVQRRFEPHLALELRRIDPSEPRCWLAPREVASTRIVTTDLATKAHNVARD